MSTAAGVRKTRRPPPQRDAPWETIRLGKRKNGEAPPHLGFVNMHLERWWFANVQRAQLPATHCLIDYARVHTLGLGGRVAHVPLAHWHMHFRNCDAVLLYSLLLGADEVYTLSIVGLVLPLQAERLDLQLRTGEATATDSLLWRQFSAPRADLRYSISSGRTMHKAWFVPTPVEIAVATRLCGGAWALMAGVTRTSTAGEMALLADIVKALLPLSADASPSQCAAKLARFYGLNQPEQPLNLSTDAGRCRDTWIRARYFAWFHTAPAPRNIDRAAHERVYILWMRGLVALTCHDEERRVMHMIEILQPTLPIYRRLLPRCANADQFYVTQNELLCAMPAQPPSPLMQQPSCLPLSRTMDDVALERLYALAANALPFPLGNVLGADQVCSTPSFLRATSVAMHHALTHVLVARDKRYCVVPRSLLTGVEYHVLLPSCPVRCHFGVLVAALTPHSVRTQLDAFLCSVHLDTQGLHMHESASNVAAREWIVTLPRMIFASIYAMESYLRATFAAHAPPPSNAQRQVFAATAGLELRFYLPTPTTRTLLLPLDAPHALHPHTLKWQPSAIGAAIAAAATQQHPAKMQCLQQQQPTEADDTAAPFMEALEQCASAQAIRTLLAPYCSSSSGAATNAPPAHLLLVPASLCPLPQQHAIGGGWAIVCYEQFEHVVCAYARHVSQQFGAHVKLVGAERALRVLHPAGFWSSKDPMFELLANSLAPLALLPSPPATPLSRSLLLTGADGELEKALQAQIVPVVNSLLTLHMEHDPESDPRRRRRLVRSTPGELKAGALKVNVQASTDAATGATYAAGSWYDFSSKSTSRSLLSLAAFVLAKGDEQWRCAANIQRARDHCVQLLSGGGGGADGDSNSSLSLSGSVDTAARSHNGSLTGSDFFGQCLTRCTTPLQAEAARYLRERRGLSDAPRALIEDNPALASATLYCRERRSDQLALVCLMSNGKAERDGRAIVAMQRIYLRADGTDKLPLDKPKLSLGPVNGNLCCLQQGSGGATVAVCEGPETALSIACAMPAWCVCTTFGTSNMAGFSVRQLWPHLTRLVYVGENDAAAHKTYENAAPIWRRAGYTQVLAFYPPADYKDANSVHERHHGAEGTEILRAALAACVGDDAMDG